jgi:hypothetical protein
MVRNRNSVNHRCNTYTQNYADGREAKVVMQRTANDVDQIKRSSPPNLTGDDRRVLRIPFRKTIAREHPQMALSTRPVKESKHRIWYSSQEISKVVFPREHIPRMEVNRVASLGPRKTFVQSHFSRDML